MWAMFSAPLIMSNDLRDISTEASQLLLNPYIIAVDQDPMGIIATKLYEVRLTKHIYSNNLIYCGWHSW